MGRPKLLKTRSEIYPIRLSIEERTQYEAKAQEAGISLAEWVRKALHIAAK
jgi:hypothetical protein